VTVILIPEVDEYKLLHTH